MWGSIREYRSCLKEKLFALGADGEVLSDFIINILEEDTDSIEQKEEYIVEYLTNALEDSDQQKSEQDILAAAREFVLQFNSCLAKQNDSKCDDESLQEKTVKQKEKIAAVLEAGILDKDGSQKKTSDSNDKWNEAFKKRVIDEFGMSVETTVEFDDNGFPIVLDPSHVSSLRNKNNNTEGMQANDNMRQAAEKEKTVREKSKKDHELEAKRRTEQKAKEKLKKEKEKSRVAKKERRSGR